MKDQHQQTVPKSSAGLGVDRQPRTVRYSRADVQLIGRVGSDPDIHFPGEASDRAWARFSVATDSRHRAPDAPDWHTVIVRDRLAQFVGRYLTRGRLVHVVGWLTYGRVQGRQCAHRVAEIHASEILMLDRPVHVQEPRSAT